MSDKGVQVVFLTATLPPSKEPTVFDAIGVKDSDMNVFRDITTRPNVKYSVVEYDRDGEDEEVQQLVEAKKEEYPAPGQIIVYCKKVEQAKILAKVLQRSVYHRTVGSNDLCFKQSALVYLLGSIELDTHPLARNAGTLRVLRVEPASSPCGCKLDRHITAPPLGIERTKASLGRARISTPIPSSHLQAMQKCRSPSVLARHLRHLHSRDSPTLASERLLQTFLEETLPSVLETPLLDPASEGLVFPPSNCRPFENLTIAKGLGCSHCPLVSVSEHRLRKHFNERHAAVSRSRGGLKGSGSSNIRDQLERKHFGDEAPWTSVCFQRFFKSGPGSAAFRVRCENIGSSLQQVDEGCSNAQHSSHGGIADRVLGRLALLEHQGSDHRLVVSDTFAKSQVSPWLERTRWPRYLAGQSLSDVAQLARPPDVGEHALKELTQAIDRLVEAAYHSVCNDRINFFAQKRIASFLPQRKAYSQPLMVKLQKATYRQYKELWKRLLCFAVRSNDPAQPIRLGHCLNSRQTALLDRIFGLGMQRTYGGVEPSHGGAAIRLPMQIFDDACLDFCISLLDHELKGDVHESTVVGYLAVLGIDVANTSFYAAVNHTSTLLGFFKISQMLVLQKAIQAEVTSQSASAFDLLDEMRARFMTVDPCTPFSSAVSLRSFGKGIADTVTSLGYIQWSEDDQTIFYKALELRVDDFRAFVAQQVRKSQKLLEE